VQEVDLALLASVAALLGNFFRYFTLVPTILPQNKIHSFAFWRTYLSSAGIFGCINLGQPSKRSTRTPKHVENPRMLFSD